MRAASSRRSSGSCREMALVILLLVSGAAGAASPAGEMVLANVTRYALGDLFSIVGSDCGPTRCMELSHGTALAALGGGDGCACQCRRDTPAFREDQKICVDHIEECPMATFGRGAKKPQIPFVFLPMKGQIIYPAKEIIFTDVEDAICAVTSAQYLSPSGWMTLRDLLDNDVPFSLYRDEGSTFLQWRGSAALHARLEGRLVAAHVLCSAPAPTRLAASCAAFRVSGASHNALLDVRSIPFHAGEIVTSEPSTQNQGLSVLESLAICVCVLMLIFVYAAGIIFYIHYKQREKRREKDPENNTLSTDGSGLGPRIDSDNVMLKTNPLLKMDNFNADFLNDAGLSDVSERTEETLDSSPSTSNSQKFQKLNSSVISAMVHTRRKKPSRPSIRSVSSPDLINERLQRRSASPEIERAPHSDLAIVDCSMENSMNGRQSTPSIGETATRRKLYFNPVFFETEHLKNPPPAAVEFLLKIREVMNIAKEKMTTKRFIPNLSDIPEEESYHSIDLGWDIPCARRGRRFSVISLKRENSRRSAHCGGCPGCDSREPVQKPLTRSNSCKSCISDDYKQKIVRKWLDEVPSPAPRTTATRPVKSIAKVNGSPRNTDSKSEESGSSPELSRAKTPDLLRITSSKSECKRIRSPEPNRVASPEPARVISPIPKRICSPELHRMSSPELERMSSPECKRVVSPKPRISSPGPLYIISTPETSPELKRPKSKRIIAPEPTRAPPLMPKRVTSPEPNRAPPLGPKRVTSPEPRIISPEPKHAPILGPKRVASPEPKRVTSPEPKRAHAPLELKRGASPEPKRVTSPEPKRAPPLGPERMTSPEPKRVRSPEPRAKSSSKSDDEGKLRPLKIIESAIKDQINNIRVKDTSAKKEKADKPKVSQEKPKLSQEKPKIIHNVPLDRENQIESPIVVTKSIINIDQSLVSNEKTSPVIPEKISPTSEASRRIRKKLPPPPPPPVVPSKPVPPTPVVQEPNSPKEDEAPIPPEIKVKMEAVIQELNKCKRVEPKELEEIKIETIEPIPPKIVIPVVAADTHYFSDDNLLSSQRKKNLFVQREPFVDMDSLERSMLKKRRFSLACGPELALKADFGNRPDLQSLRDTLTRSWRDVRKADSYDFLPPCEKPVPLTRSFPVSEVFIDTSEPLYDNIAKPGPLTIQVRGSPIESRRNGPDDFDPDTLDRKPRREAKKRIEKILLKSGGSFKHKVVPHESSGIKHFPEPVFTRKIGSLREIYEAKVKSQEEAMRLPFYERRGSVPYTGHELASLVQSVKTSEIIRKIEGQKDKIKPPVPPKQRRGSDLSPKFIRDSPPEERRRSPEERERYQQYLRGENLKRSGRRSNRTRSRRTDIRKLYRTEDSGYLSTDSNESKRRASYLMQLRPKNIPEATAVPPPPTIVRTPILPHIESDTDDMESICDGRSESGGESIETDSVFFGNFDDSKQMLAELGMTNYEINRKLGHHEQIDSGFMGETNIILSGDSDSEHRSVISIRTGRDGRTSAASITQLSDDPYMHSVEC